MNLLLALVTGQSVTINVNELTILLHFHLQLFLKNSCNNHSSYRILETLYHLLSVYSMCSDSLDSTIFARTNVVFRINLWN